MVNDKSLHFDDAEETTEGEGDVEHAPRARNRTVMLTPDITGQVRARLAKELDSASGHGGDFSAPSSGGFAPVSPRRSPEPSAEPRGRPAAPAPSAVETRTARPATRAESADRGTGTVQQSSSHGDVMEWKKLAPVVGVLVTYDRDPNGEVYPLRSGRLIVTSEMPSGGNFLFLEEESVSSMHAIMRIGDDAKVQVLDQLSEHGTVISRAEAGKEVHLSGDKAEVQHGDKISFGERTFTVCILPPR